MKISVNLWEQAYIYAVIVPTPTNDLLSAQIAGGYDQDNNKVAAQHFKSSITSSEGYVELEFTLLQSDTSYKVYVTAESLVPYEPRQRMPDTEVRSILIKTGQNLNLKDSEELIVAKIKEIKPDLAVAV